MVRAAIAERGLGSLGCGLRWEGLGRPDLSSNTVPSPKLQADTTDTVHHLA